MTKAGFIGRVDELSAIYNLGVKMNESGLRETPLTAFAIYLYFSKSTRPNVLLA